MKNELDTLSQQCHFGLIVVSLVPTSTLSEYAPRITISNIDISNFDQENIHKWMINLQVQQ
jgi:hypothetical protein